MGGEAMEMERCNEVKGTGEVDQGSDGGDERELEIDSLRDELEERRLKEHLTGLFLKQGGMGKALPTALAELENCTDLKFELRGDVLLVRDAEGRAVIDKEGREISASEAMGRFIAERDFLIEKRTRQEGDSAIGHAGELPETRTKSKGARLCLARELFGEESIGNKETLQESAGGFYMNRMNELAEAAGSKEMKKPVDARVSDREARLMTAREMRERSR